MVSLDPVAFVRGTPPFDALPPPAFEDAARALEIVFYPAGTRLLVRGGEPSRHLYVIRKGAVRLERDAQRLQLLEEGEIFGFTSLISGNATIDVTVEDDLLAYRLPRKQFEALLGHASFAGHFASGLAERLRNSLERSQVVSFQPDLAVPVWTLLRGPAVRVAKDARVGEAARLMAEQSVSSVLVDSDPPGIITDRDFRGRVLAAGRGPETPVLDVCSTPLKTVSAECPIYEAWRILLDAGCHHLPVTKNGEIVGVLSATDLLKCTAAGPVAVMKRVERLGGRDALPGYSTQVAEMASALFNGGLEPTVIGGFVARLNDTLIARKASRSRLRSIDERSDSETRLVGGSPSEMARICVRRRMRRRKRYASESVSQVSFAMRPASTAARSRSSVLEVREADSSPYTRVRNTMGLIPLSFMSKRDESLRSRSTSPPGGRKVTALFAIAERNVRAPAARAATARRRDTSRWPCTARKSKKMEASRSACGVGFSSQPRKRSSHPASAPCHFVAM